MSQASVKKVAPMASDALVQSSAKAAAMATSALKAANTEIANISTEWHKREQAIAQVNSSTDVAQSSFKAFNQFLS